MADSYVLSKLLMSVLLKTLLLFCFAKQGDLKTVLRQREASGKPVLFHQQLSALLQLCDAMQYLTAQRFVHRDVAAHSCLVGEDMLVGQMIF